MQAVRPVGAGRRGQPARLGARVLTVAGGATLAAARRALVTAAAVRLRDAYGPSGAVDAPVQGVQVVGRGASGVTTYGALAHAVGGDAAPYALVRTRANRPVVVDLDVWSRRDADNPLVAVWAVPVRTAGLLRTAAGYGVHPGRLDDRHDERTARLAGAVDAVPAAARLAAARGEPHRLAERLERVASVHETALALAHGELSTVRDDPTGPDAAAYRSRLSLLARCAREVTDAVAALGLVVPERL